MKGKSKIVLYSQELFLLIDFQGLSKIWRAFLLWSTTTPVGDMKALIEQMFYIGNTLVYDVWKQFKDLLITEK